MSKIGFIDCDRKNSRGYIFPNLPIMKLSAWHKAQGDTCQWYDVWDGLVEEYDIVYESKVFSFSDDFSSPIYSKKVIRGGSGFAIRLIDGKEVYDKSLDKPLPYEIEHIYPDYDLYGITDTAYGFLTRGCPRNCSFCHVTQMQGKTSIKVAELSEFWRGQPNIILLDANITACKDRMQIMRDLIDSKACIDFSQGLDARMFDQEFLELLSQIKTEKIHMAWDRIEDERIVFPKLQMIKDITRWDRRKLVVYCLTGDRERKILDSDLYRINKLRQAGLYPYITIYDKESLPKGHELKKLQRWVNNRFVWEACETFNDYLDYIKKEGEN